MPLPTASLLTWILSLGWDATQETGAPLVTGPFVPAMPDRLVIITPTPGPGYQLEGAADASAFQARVRGPQDDQAAAEALAYALDSLIFSAPFPAVMGGRVIVHCHRLSGGPSPLAPAPDEGDRWEYVTSYVLIASV